MLVWFCIAAAVAQDAPADGSTWANARRGGDAAVGRGLLSSHAETQPAGMLAVNSHDLLVLGATYGVTDDLQVAVSGLLPVLEGSPRLAMAEVRRVIWRRSRTVGAVRGLGGVAYRPADAHTAATLGGGLLVDWQPLDAGWLTVHGGLGAGSGVGQAVSEVVDLSEGALLLGELGFVARLHPRLHLVAEAWLPTVFVADSRDFDSLPFVVVPYGLRFAGPVLSVDLGLVKGLAPDLPLDPWGFGFPYLAATLRFDAR